MFNNLIIKRNASQLTHIDKIMMKSLFIWKLS